MTEISGRKSRRKNSATHFSPKSGILSQNSSIFLDERIILIRYFALHYSIVQTGILIQSGITVQGIFSTLIVISRIIIIIIIIITRGEKMENGYYDATNNKCETRR